MRTILAYAVIIVAFLILLGILASANVLPINVTAVIWTGVIAASVGAIALTGYCIYQITTRRR